MEDSLTLFNFNLTWAIFNGLCSTIGFIGWELWQYKKDEEAYSKENKKGDYLFGFLFVPFCFTFGIPYVWDYLDKNTWYNPATSITLGFLFDFVVLWALDQAKKKTEK